MKTLLQVLILATAFMGQAAAQQPRKDMVQNGDAQCTRCHNEGDEFPVLAIAKTKHGTMADARTPTCISCHGMSDTHVNRPADAKERPKPDRTFGKHSKTPTSENVSRLERHLMSAICNQTVALLDAQVRTDLLRQEAAIDPPSIATASASSWSSRISQPASSSTKPIISTACCFWTGCVRSKR